MFNHFDFITNFKTVTIFIFVLKWRVFRVCVCNKVVYESPTLWAGISTKRCGWCVRMCVTDSKDVCVLCDNWLRAWVWLKGNIREIIEYLGMYNSMFAFTRACLRVWLHNRGHTHTHTHTTPLMSPSAAWFIPPLCAYAFCTGRCMPGIHSTAAVDCEVASHLFSIQTCWFFKSQTVHSWLNGLI